MYAALGSYESDASDVTDREWGLIAPSIARGPTGGRPRSTCLKRVVNAIFLTCFKPAASADFAAGLPAAQHGRRRLRAWIVAGVWAQVDDVLYRRSRSPEGREESVPHPPLEAFGQGVLGRLARARLEAPVERHPSDEL